MPLAVDRAVKFLLKHAYKTAVFGEVRRRDVYSIPIEPIREVIVNALVHASYVERGTPIKSAFTTIAFKWTARGCCCRV